MLEETNVVATLGANTVREWCNSRGKAGKTEGKHTEDLLGLLKVTLLPS